MKISEKWKKVHFDFFKSIDKCFNDDSKIVLEIFELVSKEVDLG